MDVLLYWVIYIRPCADSLDSVPIQLFITLFIVFYYSKLRLLMQLSRVYFVYLRWANGCVIVLGNLHPALRGFVRLCFNSTIHYFVHCFLLFHVGIVNTITLGYFILCYILVG